MSVPDAWRQGYKTTNEAEETSFANLTPTSHPDLFVDGYGRLVHRLIGRFGPRPFVALTLPDGAPLEIFRGAPMVTVDVAANQREAAAKKTEPGAVLPESLLNFLKTANVVFTSAGVARDLLSFIENLLFEPTVSEFARLDQKLNAIMLEVGALDSLARLREMARMRGNAETIRDLLHTLGTQLEDDPTSWYTGQLRDADLQLHQDIKALLDPSEAYFRRVYVEKAIEGDGKWMRAIPDRPVDEFGVSFDHSLALPTAMLLISLRVSMMKYTVPDFVDRGSFSEELDSYWRRLQQLSDRMTFHVRKTPVTQIELQAARRQQMGQRLGEYIDWQTHLDARPPLTVIAVGAADITTGVNSINWDYTQFDEWYLRQGNLHGHPAGYWPPSVGPRYYEPAPTATDLPPMDDRTIQQYYSMVNLAATVAVRQVQTAIGVNDVSEYAWMMARLAYPGAPI